MSDLPIEFTRALGVDPAGRGLGFALVEDSLALVDWGFYNARKDRDARCFAQVIFLLTKFEPDLLVLEDFEGRRPERVRALADAFAAAAQERGIVSHRVSRTSVRSQFPSSRTKYDIARELSANFPEISPWCPPARKIWMSEDPRINIFDALSLAVTHLTLSSAGARKK